MRIAFIAYQGSVHTQRWASFYARAGHDVHVVTCGGGAMAPETYAVHDLGAPRLGKAGYLLKLRAARRELARIAPDLVHAHWVTSYGLLAYVSGVRPLVVTAHGDDLLIAPRNPVLRRVVTSVLRAADLVTVPSEQMREAACALAGRDTPVEVFQYGVEASRLMSVAARARADRTATAQLAVVSARPLLELYRFDVLLDALALLATRGVVWSYDVYGDGPERAALETRAHGHGIEGRVRFHGQRPPEEVEQALARADIYVSVAESDGASIALLEALALGPVPVLSDIPANRPWVRDGETGVLTAIEPAAVAHAIERAAALDGEVVRSANQSVVCERADQDRNLGRLDDRLHALVSSGASDEARTAA